MNTQTEKCDRRFQMMMTREEVRRMNELSERRGISNAALLRDLLNASYKRSTRQSAA
jgi:hypothetical protein